MNDVVRDAAQEQSPGSGEAACSHDDEVYFLRFGGGHDALARFARPEQVRRLDAPRPGSLDNFQQPRLALGP